MTKVERDKSIRDAVQTMVDILDGEARLHILPTGTIEITRAARHRFKLDVLKALGNIYKPSDEPV